MNSSIHAQIRPFNRTATYPTSWAGSQSYNEIYDNLAHYASNLMKRFGFRPHEIPDCLQIGFTVLWETLVQQRDFLHDKTRRQAVFFVLARCKISSMRYRQDRCDSLDALTTEDWHSTADEHAITGLEADRDERWAAWATDIDTRLDVEQIMHKLAAKYEHSFRHLIALYAVTTQITRKDAAALAGITPWNWHKTYVEPMLREVRYEFAQVFLEHHRYAQPVAHTVERPGVGRFTERAEHWRDEYQRGNTAPAEALLQKYANTVCISAAIRARLDGKSYRQAALDNGRKPQTFSQYMKRASRLLAAAYA